MKRVLVGGLVLVLCVASVSFAVADAAAEQTPRENAAKKPKSEDKPSDEDKPAGNPQESDKPNEDKPEDKPKPLPVINEYERKMLAIKKRVAEAEKRQVKVSKAESKVNAQISKMRDPSKKPVDTALLRKEIAEHHPSRNAKTYRKLTLTLAGGQEKLAGTFAKAWSDCVKLKKMDIQDEGLKTKGEALAAGVKDQYIAALMKLAILYERVSETKKVTACYTRILKVDRKNSAALSYFKELKKKESSSGGSSFGGGGFSGGSRGR